MLRNSLWLALLLSFQVHATEEPIFYNGFEPAEAGPPICPPIPTGYTTGEKSWVQAFDFPGPNPNPPPVYPNGVSNPSPIPGWQNYPSTWFIKNQIVAIPITPLPDKTVDMTWDNVQAQFGYPPRPSLGVFVKISPCKWDVEPPVDYRCGAFAGGASLFYTTRRPEFGGCPVEAAMQYYINVVMANPYDGLDIGEHSCDDSAANTTTYNGCDVQMKHSGY